MLITPGQKLIVIVLIAMVMVGGLAGLLFQKPETDAVMAQEEGDDQAKRISNGEAMQAEIEDFGPGDLLVAPFEARPVGESGAGVVGPPQIKEPNWAYSLEHQEGWLEVDGRLEGVVAGSGIDAGEEMSRRHPPVIR